MGHSSVSGRRAGLRMLVPWNFPFTGIDPGCQAHAARWNPLLMLIDYYAITHQGRVRKNNEDAYLVSALDGEEPLVNGLRPLAKTCQAGILAAVAVSGQVMAQWIACLRLGVHHRAVII